MQSNGMLHSVNLLVHYDYQQLLLRMHVYEIYMCDSLIAYVVVAPKTLNHLLQLCV